MKTAWQVRRPTRAGADGERRWDYAYQFLLQWAMADAAGGWCYPSNALGRFMLLWVRNGNREDRRPRRV
jgi:hypothetical protein